MLLTNTRKLKALLVEKNIKTRDVAKFLKISNQSFSMKINNKREFKVSEIIKLSNLLQIDNFKVLDIFFTNDVDFNSTEILCN